MLQDFYAFLDAFTAPRNLTWEKKDNPALVSLEIEGCPVNICYFEDRDMLFFQGAVAFAPENSNEREAFWKRLLVANNGFSETKGATLGYDAENDIVTLQLTWTLHGLQQEQFDTLTENFVMLLAQWLQELAHNAPTGNNEASASGASDEIAMPEYAMLRV